MDKATQSVQEVIDERDDLKQRLDYVLESLNNSQGENKRLREELHILRTRMNATQALASALAMIASVTK